MYYPLAQLFVGTRYEMLDVTRILAPDVGKRDAREAAGELLGQHCN